MKATKEEIAKQLSDLARKIESEELTLIEVRMRRNSVMDYEDEFDGIKHFIPSDDFWIELRLVNK